MQNNLLIDIVLNRGVDEIIDRVNLEKKLRSGKKLRVKLGIDPTSPNLHLGRSIPLMKLRDFQALGHTPVLIIGDFTGIIGDTSDKDSERPMLERETIENNLKTYIDQASKIIDIEKSEVRYNSEWLDGLRYRDIGTQADRFSLNEFISRENIKKRLDAGKRVSLRELFYPLMQGYDSIAVQADVELGGTDQRFNLLAGRELQRLYGQDAQDILMNPLIEGLDGRKMSSSWGNTVNLLEEPNSMFGKLMSLQDEFIIRYFTFLTRVDMELVGQYDKEMKSGANPRDYKMKLGHEIVRFYHSPAEADAAQEYFIRTISNKETPDEMPAIKPSSYDILTALIESGCIKSKGEGRRTIAQNGVKLNRELVSDPTAAVKPGDVIQKGKTNFFKIN